jgi:DNA modification methylase
MMVRAYQAAGWIYHGRITIDKDPQAQAIRTKSKALLFVQMRKDSSWLRPALADYILVFRKPGENAVPVQPDLSNEDWIEWARPIWYGIRESDTLNVAEARADKDERHICPLQLGTIERCIRLWSNPGELIISPFAGIGSEGYEAVRLGRKFWGCELKPEYAAVAAENLGHAEALKLQGSLFASVGE